MHDAACIRSSESTCRLLDYIQSDGERHRSIAAHTRFKRFAFDQFHRVKTLSISKEGKANETPQAFAVRTTLSQRSSAGRAVLRSFTLRFRGSEAHADVVHVGKSRL